MKKRMFVLAGVCLSALSVHALADMARPVRFTLPQPVAISSVTLPAGECTMDTINTNTSSTVLAIHCTDGTAATAAAMRVMRTDGRVSDRTELVLHNTAGKLTIHNVWLEGEAYGYELLSQ